MRAGAVRVDITPPPGLPMSGNLPDTRRAKGADSPLYCRSLVLEDHGKYVAVTACDLLVLERAYSDKAFEIASRTVGFPTGCMMLCCSHTHSGPQTTDEFLAPMTAEIESYLENLSKLMAESIIAAYASLQAAHIGVAAGRIIENIGENSRYLLQDGTIGWFGYSRDEIVKATGPVDPEIIVLHAVDDKGKTIGLIYNYACHACTGVGENYFADYPGLASAIVEESLGGTALFLPGACGDIHPVSAWLSGDTDKAVEKNGRAVADAVLGAVSRIDKHEEDGLACLKRNVALPTRDLTLANTQSIDEFLRIRNLELSARRDIVSVYEAELERLRRDSGPTVDTVLQVIKIGECAIAGIPGELFVEFGLDIKGKSAARHTMVAELANDWVGYIPTEQAFTLGGYQTWPAKGSRLSPQAGDMIVREITAMLAEI